MNLDAARSKMEKAIDHFEDQTHGINKFGGVRVSSLIDTIRISCYGQKTPLKHLASTSPMNGGVSVEPHDPSILKAIEKGCKDAGYNAYVFSKSTVMVSIPPPSGEDKVRARDRLKKIGEETKVSIRNIRKKAKQAVPKDTPKNQKKKLEKDLQALTDEAINMVEAILAKKLSFV
jgi:ribosome recycling factor